MSKRYARGLWWVKRDFRLADNDALCAAVAQCDTVLAVFVIEPSLCRAEETSLFHYHAWQQASESLASQLSRLGGQLLIQLGETTDVFDVLYKHTGFDAIFSHEETGSAVTFARDQAVRHWCTQRGVPWIELHQNGVVRALNDRAERQAMVRQRLFDTAPQTIPPRIPTWPVALSSDPWPAFEHLADRAPPMAVHPQRLQIVTEQQANDDLHAFLTERGKAYSGGISSPNTAFTAGSRLSAHLAWGTLSLRQVFYHLAERSRELATTSSSDANQWRRSLTAFQSRLHWHDHFMQRLESEPTMEVQAINPAYRQLPYLNDDGLLAAWEHGNTGIPLVDACMRCLAATGFLNFRMRAMLVTTACFGLGQDWRRVQYPLARLFRDYEPGIHISQVQMQAGVVGINTLRVYSPLKQLLDQDPDAHFVKRWVPELRPFDAATIATYDTTPLGDYPAPVVDINLTARRIKDNIQAVRRSAIGRQHAQVVLAKYGSTLGGRDRIGNAGQQKKTQRQAQAQQGKQHQLKLDLE